MEAKFLYYGKRLPMMPLMAVAMDRRYKLKGIIVCMLQYNKNMEIDECD